MDRIRGEFGMLCAVVANSNAWGGDGKAKQPSDFYPDERAQARQQTPEEQEAFLALMFGRPKKKP